MDSNNHSTGLQDLKNLVKSIYEVLGKSMSRPKSTQKDPVKKLCVQLSLSKERSRDVTDMGRRECLLTTNYLQEHPKKSKAKRFAAVEREGSMTVNPPSTDFLSHVRPSTHPDHHGRSGVHHRRSSSCRRCEQRQPIEKDCLKNGTRRACNPVDSKGMYHYPKRMQTGPGECNPPSSSSNEMARVKECINQWSHTYDKNEDGTTEEHQRYKQKHKHRHRVCQADGCEVGCGLRRCPQYLDLATDHVTYPYHTGSLSFAFGNTSPKAHHHKQSEHTHCKHNCCRDSDMYHHDGQPIIHRHEHHHHHSHHHYHHYVS